MVGSTKEIVKKPRWIFSNALKSSIIQCAVIPHQATLVLWDMNDDIIIGREWVLIHLPVSTTTKINLICCKIKKKNI